MPNSFFIAQQPARECMVEEPTKEASEFMNDVVKNFQKELVEINLTEEGKEKMVKISKALPEKEKRRLIALLK